MLGAADNAVIGEHFEKSALEIELMLLLKKCLECFGISPMAAKVKILGVASLQWLPHKGHSSCIWKNVHIA